MVGIPFAIYSFFKTTSFGKYQEPEKSCLVYPPVKSCEDETKPSVKQGYWVLAASYQGAMDI